ncbi:MAG: ATP-binding protein [Bacteroidota bacterium]
MDVSPRLLLVAPPEATLPLDFPSETEPFLVPSAAILAAALREEPTDAVLVLDATEAEDALGVVLAHDPETPFVAVTDEPLPGVPSVPPEALAGWLSALHTPLPAWSSLPIGPVPTDSLDSFAKHLPIGVYRSTPDGRILYANPALATILSVESVEALGEIDVREDLGYPRDHFAEEIARSGSVQNLVVWWRDPTGREVYTRENGRAVYDDDGEVLYYEGTMEDVTAEHRARARERRRARQLEALVRFGESADLALDREAILHAAVAAGVEATGADWGILVFHQNGENRIAAASSTFPEGAVQQLEASGALSHVPLETETLLLRDVESRGSQVPEVVRLSMTQHGFRSFGSFPLVRDGQAAGAFIAGFNTPHTFDEEERQLAEALAWHLAGSLARVRAERGLRDTEASLQFIADTTNHVFYRLRYSAEGSAFEYLSPAVETLTGFSVEALEEEGGLAALIVSREVRSGEGLSEGPVPDATHYAAVYQMRTADGDLRWVENSAYPWLREDGEPVGLVGVLHDVTERHRHEEEQAARAERSLAFQTSLAALAHLNLPSLQAFAEATAEEATASLDASAVSVCLFREDGPLCATRSPIHLTPPAPTGEDLSAVLGYMGSGRAVGIADLSKPSASAPSREALIASGVRSVLWSPILRAGEAIGLVGAFCEEPTPWDEAAYDYAAGLADAVALAVERADRSRAEEALREREIRHRTLAELSSDYALVVRQNDGLRSGEVVWVGGAVEQITGYPATAFEDVAMIRQVVHPDSLQTARHALVSLQQQREATFEAQLITREGEMRWVLHRVRLGEPGSRLTYHSGQDITHRKRAEAALIEAREQAEAGREVAEELGRLKGSFLANMSHEIRTPLTGILGFADLLAEELEGEHREYAEFIERSGRRLLDTLNSVLDLSRLQADRVQPELQTVDLAAEAREVVQLLSAMASDQGLTLRVHAPRTPVYATLDPTCINRIVHNLVGNAIKFTEAGGVDVIVEPEARLVVRDTGIGIDPDFLPHLFDEFRQASQGEARSHEGSGLGLAITRRLVELMGGSIDVESELGQGTTFSVQFDLAPAPHGPRTVTPLPGDSPLEKPGLQPPSASQVEPPTRVTGGDGAISGEESAFIVRPPSDPPILDSKPEGATYIDVGPSDSPVSAWLESLVGAETPPAQPETSAPDSPALPPPPAPQLQTPSPPADTESDSSEGPSLPFEPAMTDSHLAAPADATAEDDRPVVLVVEDNADTRMLLDRILRKTYRVQAVGGAREALVAMNHQRFDALVLDINLGGKETGADVLRIARSLPDHGDVHAIALTAYALPGDRERLLSAGFDAYISKPFTRHALLEELASGIKA